MMVSCWRVGIWLILKQNKRELDMCKLLVKHYICKNNNVSSMKICVTYIVPFSFHCFWRIWEETSYFAYSKETLLSYHYKNNSQSRFKQPKKRVITFISLTPSIPLQPPPLDFHSLHPRFKSDNLRHVVTTPKPQYHGDV